MVPGFLVAAAAAAQPVTSGLTSSTSVSPIGVTLPPCGGRIIVQLDPSYIPVKPTTGLSHIISLYVIAMVSVQLSVAVASVPGINITFQHQVSRTFNHRWCAVIHNNHLHTLSRITTVIGSRPRPCNGGFLRTTAR